VATEAAVAIVIAAEPEQAALLASVVVDPLNRLGISVSLLQATRIDPATVITPQRGGSSPLARVFIDATQGDVAIVYLVDATWERILVRRLLLERGLDEVAREELAHIVEASVLALRAGGRIGVTREQASRELGVDAKVAAEPVIRLETVQKSPPTSLPRQRTMRRTPARLELRAGLGWGLVAWTQHVLAQGPDLRFDVSTAQERLTWGAAIAAQYRLHREVEAEPVGVGVSGAALRLLGRGRYRSEPHFALIGELGGGFDYERFEPLAASTPRVSLSPAGGRVSPLVCGLVGLEVELERRVWLSVRGGVEVDIAPEDYVVLHNGQILPIAEPLRARPLLSAHVLWSL
jgi:hypothetical protein